MFGTKLRTNINGNGPSIADETIRRVTREKVVIRGNTTIRTMDSTTSFLPLIERYVYFDNFTIIFAQPSRILHNNNDWDANLCVNLSARWKMRLRKSHTTAHQIQTR